MTSQDNENYFLDEFSKNRSESSPEILPIRVKWIVRMKKVEGQKVLDWAIQKYEIGQSKRIKLDGLIERQWNGPWKFLF